jgi:tripartite-type tricarboxylate transporter receptor subunit TctC
MLADPAEDDPEVRFEHGVREAHAHSESRTRRVCARFEKAVDMKTTVAAALAGILVAAGVVATDPSAAQSYPSKPVRFLIGFSAGGGSDILARALAPRLSEQLGQQVLVDNRPGANGMIAAEVASKAPADGHTLLVAPGNYVFGQVMEAKQSLDMTTAFAPVSLLGATPLLAVVHPSMPIASIRQLVAMAKAHPDKLSYASGGIGGSGHLGVELFKSLTQVKMVHVPYKGNGAAIADLIGGQVPLCFCTLPSIFSHVKSGRLRPLAVTVAKRTPFAPEIPTIAESGLPGYEMSQWYGLLAPAGVPTSAIDRLNAELAKALTLPEVRTRFATEGAEPVSSTPQEFGRFYKAEIAKWTAVVQKAGIRRD